MRAGRLLRSEGSDCSVLNAFDAVAPGANPKAAIAIFEQRGNLSVRHIVLLTHIGKYAARVTRQAVPRAYRNLVLPVFVDWINVIPSDPVVRIISAYDSLTHAAQARCRANPDRSFPVLKEGTDIVTEQSRSSRVGDETDCL